MIKTTNFKHYKPLINVYVSHYIDTMLVLGCGALNHELFIPSKNVLGVDLALSSLNISKAKAPVIRYDVRNISDIILPKSFDVVTLFDIVEHLEKEDAYKLIRNAEIIARKQVVIFIPIEDDYVSEKERFDSIVLQEQKKQAGLPMGYHLSKWDVKDIEELGYSGEYSTTYHKDSKYEHQKGWGAVFAVKTMEDGI